MNLAARLLCTRSAACREAHIVATAARLGVPMRPAHEPVEAVAAT